MMLFFYWIRLYIYIYILCDCPISNSHASAILPDLTTSTTGYRLNSKPCLIDFNVNFLCLHSSGLIPSNKTCQPGRLPTGWLWSSIPIETQRNDSRWLSMTQGKSPRWLRQYLSDSRDGISTGTFHRHNRSKVPRYAKPGTHIKTCRGQKVSEATK